MSELKQVERQSFKLLKECLGAVLNIINGNIIINGMSFSNIKVESKSEFDFIVAVFSEMGITLYYNDEYSEGCSFIGLYTPVKNILSISCGEASCSHHFFKDFAQFFK